MILFNHQKIGQNHEKNGKSIEKIDKTSWGWAVPSSVEVKVWGLVKALRLIFENDNVEEVWSQSSLKLKKLLDEKVWSFSWWSLKLKKV